MSKTETRAMSLGDHMRRFDEEVDRLAEVAHRIDEELIRIEFNKPLRDRERPSRWPGAYISGYQRVRFQQGGLWAGAPQEWHAAWLGEVEERFDQSPLLRPLFQQYAERLATIETVLNMGLQPVSHATPAPSKWAVEPPAASDSDPLAFKSLAELDQEHSKDDGEHRPHLKSGDSACSFCGGINRVHSDRCQSMAKVAASREPLPVCEDFEDDPAPDQLARLR